MLSAPTDARQLVSFSLDGAESVACPGCVYPGEDRDGHDRVCPVRVYPETLGAFAGSCVDDHGPMAFFG